ncbi:VOC family protein [Agromyces sp. NPDC057865]|uniref:VOC family protein n=1 Tax=Agromyces sp. NPDC057865 TaxID=3346267 RepID=UPI003671C54F
MLYCGPIAHFAAASVHAGVAFATAITALDELADHPPLIDVQPSGVTVRLHADIQDLTDDGVADRARVVSAVAHERGLTPRPDLTQDVQIAIATQLPIEDVRPFWRAVLGYADHESDDLIDPRGRGPSVWLQQLDPEKPLQHAMHLDLAVPREIAGRRLDAAIAAGGRVASDVAAVRYWTCADAAGNKVDLVAWPDLPMPEDEALRLGADSIDPGALALGRPVPESAAKPSGPSAVAGLAELEQGEAMFEAFREASDLVDWPMLFWGPTAWFGTGSLARSAELAARLAELDGTDRLHLDLRAEGLAVRLALNPIELVEADLDLARRISAVARHFGTESDPSHVQTIQMAIASKPDDDVRPFWRELFGYAELGAEDLVDRQGRGMGLWFQELPADKPLRHAFHIDVSVPRAVGRARVDAALAAGGRIVASNDEEWWTLADPAGNKVDVAIWPDRDVAG